MVEREPTGMEKLALELEIAGHAVDRVAGDRKLDRLQVYANLVRASCLKRDFQQRPWAEQLHDFEQGHGIPRRRRIERVSRPIDPVTTDRSLDPARARSRRPFHEREVAPLDLTPANRLLKSLVRGVGPRDDEQAGSVAVEAVDNSRPILVTAGRVEGEQPVDERAGVVTRTGMNHDAGGLVDNEQVLVLPCDAEVHLLGDKRCRVCRQLDEDVLPTCQPMAFGAGLTVDEDGPIGDQSFCQAS